MKLRGVSAALVVLAIAVILLIGAVGYLYMENTKYQETIASLEEEISNLVTQVNQAQSEVNQLKSERNNLLNRISQLEQEKSQLESQVASLESQLQQYSNIENELSYLRNVVNLRVTEIIYTDETVNLPAGGLFGPATYEYYFSPSYAGYYLLTFTATGNITVKAYVSYGGRSYTLEWNMQSGTLLIPVLPGTVTIQFLNYNVLFGVTITFDLTYVY